MSLAPGSSPRSSPPPIALTAGEWRAHAACRNHRRLKAATWDDSTVGIREPAEQRTKRIAAAKAVCRNECPVRQQCRDDVNLDYDEGVRGGEDLRDVRAALRRAAFRQAKRSASA